MKMLSLIFVSFFFYSAVNGQSIDSSLVNGCATPQELEIFKEFNSPDSGQIEIYNALFALEKLTTEQVNLYLKNLDEMKIDLEKKIKPKHDAKKRSEIIFKYLHNQFLKKYLPICNFSAIFSKNEYNCLTSTVLFSIFANTFDIPHSIYLTPNHVFTVVENGVDKITIEMTDPQRGYNFKGEEDELIEYLIEYKIVTMDELRENGKSKIYSDYVDGRKKISTKQLVATAYVNYAYDDLINNNHSKILCNYSKALSIFPNHKPLMQGYVFSLGMLISENESNPDVYWDYFKRAFTFNLEEPDFRDELWQLTEAIIYLELENRKIEKAEKLVNEIHVFSIGDSLGESKIKEIRKTIDVEKMRIAYIRGNYKDAFLAGLANWESISEHPAVQEMVVHSGINYAIDESNNDDMNSAISIMDTLLVFNKEYPLIKKNYVDMIIRSVSMKIFITSEYQKSERYLRRAYEVAPEDKRLQVILPRFYHELAMEKLRNEQYQIARTVAERGLSLFPNDKNLNIALDQIIEVIAFRNQQDRQKKK